MISALINAGGNSTRMGSHKALLSMPSDERPLLAHVVETAAAVVDDPIYVVANHPMVLAAARQLPNVMVISDQEQGKGPLAGLAAGLALVSDWSLVLACDMPLLQVDLLRLLVSLCRPASAQTARLDEPQDGQWDVVLPIVDGRAETLCAVYHRRCLPFIQAMLRQENLRIRDLFTQVCVRYVQESELCAVDPTLQSFTNVNTPQEWDAIQQKLRAA